MTDKLLNQGLTPEVLMISKYTMFWRYSDLTTKKCDEDGCCKTMDNSLSITYRAWDVTDFNDGDAFHIGLITIDDGLINDCFKLSNSDFNIYAVESKTVYNSRGCKKDE